jgi:hypothetical protein
MFMGPWATKLYPLLARSGDVLHCTFLFVTQKQTSKQSEKSLFDANNYSAQGTSSVGLQLMHSGIVPLIAAPDLPGSFL